MPQSWFRYSLIALSCIILTVMLISLVHPVSKIDTPQRLTVAGQTIKVYTAKTAAEQAKGLAGIDYLSPDQGMYFAYKNASHVTFWMKGMTIPIDIIWIQQGKVVGINANVAAPAPNTPDDQLLLYPSPSNQLDGVLEIAALQSQKLGIAVGDSVALQP